MGPASAERLRLAYHNVDDIDLFVAGLAERPVSGGLVGPTFACIIAQQFSNLRRGDRFWYENFGFESSFTPAQLQSLRRTTLAQVSNQFPRKTTISNSIFQILCRSLESGTLQPHVFLPATFHRNERTTCGHDELEPIDLTPWTEHDPFTTGHKTEPLLESPFSTSNNEVSNKLDLDSIDKLHTETTTKRPTTKRPTTTTKRQKQKKTTKVNNKLDFTKTTKQGLKRPVTKTSGRKTNKTVTAKRKRTKRRTLTTTNGWFMITENDDWTVLEDKKGRARPIGYQNNRPIYEKTEEKPIPDQWIDRTPDVTVDKRTPDHNLEYWKKFISTIRPPTTISYDIEVPLLSTSTKRTYIRPRTTTKKTYMTDEIQTFLQKDNFVYPSTTSDPLTYFISSTTSMSSLYHPEISYPQDAADLDVHNIFSSSIGHVKPWKDFRKRPTTTTTTTPEPPKLDTDPDDVYYFNDRDWERVDYRPQTVTDVAKDSTKFYYVDNVLHKIEPTGIYRKRPTKRYTEPNLVVPLIKQIVGQLDSQMTDMTNDEANIHWITRTDGVERRDADISLLPTLTRLKRKKQTPVAFVPLVLLTNVERKDNWVHVEARTKKEPLPEMPTLEAEGAASAEVPRPMRSV